MTPPERRSAATVMRGDARWAAALIMAGALLYLMVGVFSLAVFIRTIGRGLPASVMLGVSWVGIAQYLLYFIGGIVVLAWLRRVNLRLRAAGRQGLSFSPGMTVVWFIIPFANLVLPPQVMQELWRASDPRGDADSWRSSPTSPLPMLWWYPFLVGNFVANIGAMIAEEVGLEALLVGNVLSTGLLMFAAVSAVRYIRQVDARMAALEGVTHAERASSGLGVPGALVGALVGAGVYATLLNTFGILGLIKGPGVVLFLVALLSGAAVGYLTALGAGGRNAAVAVIAGVSGYLMIVITEVALSFARLGGFRGDPGRMLERLVGMLAGAVTDPLATGVAVTAVIGAVAAVLLRLPSIVWRIRAIPASATAPTISAVPAPPTASAPPPPPPGAAAPSPPPAPEHRVAPMEASPPAQVVMAEAATQPQPAPVPQTPPDPAAAARQRRTALIAGGIVVGLLALCGLTVGAVVVVRAVLADQRSAPLAEPSSEVPVEAPAPVAPEQDSAPAFAPEGVPEDVVRELYAAAAAGETAAARATFANPGDLDPMRVSAWGSPDFAIEMVTAGDMMGDLMVQVREAGGGFSDESTVTWTIREIDGHWLIIGWKLGGVMD